MQDNAELEKLIQDIFSEIRYIAHQVEALANALKALLPENK